MDQPRAHTLLGLERLTRRYEARTGKRPDFSAAYWTPPLPARDAFELERNEIEDGLGLHGIVSLTDHDTIAAGCELRSRGFEIPISVEWTVPFADTFFHLGVHNLPVGAASDMMAALARYTARPAETVLRELLARLDAESGVLIVLNHPLWDQAEIGKERHTTILRQFLHVAADRIHAVELNGLRSWQENRNAADLAGDLDRPLISGGDRHGCEPNAVINLTNAATFAEFADEVRSGCSHVLFLPSYREPLGLRIVQTLFDVLHYSRDQAERERWTDRVFYTRHDGEFVTLSSVWAGGGPAVVRWFVRSVEFAGHDSVQQPLRRLCTVATARRHWSMASSVSPRHAVTPTY